MTKEELREEFVDKTDELQRLLEDKSEVYYEDDMPDCSYQDWCIATTQGEIEALKIIAHNQNPYLLYTDIGDALRQANEAIGKLNRLIRARANFNGHEPKYRYSIEIQETKYLCEENENN